VSPRRATEVEVEGRRIVLTLRQRLPDPSSLERTHAR
jgi:hypothetical protein